jgi:hypothetical protein
MSFNTEKNKPANYKIFLCEIDLPITQSLFFSYSAGIYWIPLSPNFGTGGVSLTTDDGYTMYYDDTYTNPLMRVGSIQVDGENYAVTTSISACESQNKSIYYDQSNYMCYCHFDGFTIPWNHAIRLGLILGFCDKTDKNGNSYYDDIYYDPRIKSVPSLAKKRDNLFAGILQHLGGNITFINSDGYFEDLIASWNLFGQPIRIYAGFDGLSFSDFRQIYSGIIDDYTHDFDTFKINITDTRKFLSRKLPINQFSTSEFGYLSTDNAGVVKPIAWGNIRNAKTICVNETATTPSTYQFFIADITYNPINSVSNVYIDNDTILSTTKWTLSGDSVYISTGASTTTRAGDSIYVADNLANITVDFTAFSTNTLGMDVITNLLNDYAFISTETAVNNYDSTEWVTELAQSRQVGVYVDKEKEINLIIKDICVAEDGVLIVLDDGRLTFRHDSTTYNSARVIRTDEWINEPQIDYKRDEFLTSVKIKYNKNQSEDGWQSYTNTDYESTGYEKYKTYEQKEFETILTSTTDVYAKTLNIMAKSKDIVPTIQRKLKQQNIDLEIMDIITAEHGRTSDTVKTWADYRIIGITKDLNSAEDTWTMRWVQTATSTNPDEPYYEIEDITGTYIVDIDGNNIIGIK